MTHVFFDLDGVIFKFNFGASEEEIHTPGYFENLEEDQLVVNAIKNLLYGEIAKIDNVKLHILSAAFNSTAVEEKKRAVKRIGLGDIDQIYLPYGTDKSKYVSHLGGKFILVDDFTKNLIAWGNAGENFIPVKYLNGGNDTHQTFKGVRVGLCDQDTFEKELLALIQVEGAAHE